MQVRMLHGRYSACQSVGGIPDNLVEFHKFPPRQISTQLVDPRRHDEIVFRKASRLVAGEIQSYLAPGEKYIRMMLLLFSDFPDLVRKIPRLLEVGKLKAAFQLLSFNLPFSRNLLRQ